MCPKACNVSTTRHGASKQAGINRRSWGWKSFSNVDFHLNSTSKNPNSTRKPVYLKNVKARHHVVVLSAAERNVNFYWTGNRRNEHSNIFSFRNQVPSRHLIPTKKYLGIDIYCLIRTAYENYSCGPAINVTSTQNRALTEFYSQNQYEELAF